MGSGPGPSGAGNDVSASSAGKAGRDSKGRDALAGRGVRRLVAGEAAG